ncbi:MAG: hypothetical protein A3H96_02715 [Acidobacteria bacterium RIFCSPLOWO2_02_FULL_67_36]|nr:MAG: hypothetical protein A3H96_02715 [Acidobacteria bacterium RIFCSPLOWO2_02_FULL_67_36]OFW19630.1 MAG: hypothetical protein A3G21_21745 [Acidobacteria bacterium RIFCSPLOWO2_12_FULL_66_21]
MTDGSGQAGWHGIWQELLLRNTPFRAAEDEDYQDLLRQLKDLERLFLERPDLGSYYAECMQVSAPPPAAQPVPSGAPLADTVHVSAMQLQLMEDAYYSLRLDQYANSPDNRGWMNLFRRWAWSATFQWHCGQLQSTFSEQFVEFFEKYIRAWESIDQEPIPHPWDVPETPTPAVPYAAQFAAGIRRALERSDKHRRVGGLYLDPGRREAGSPAGRPPGPREQTQHPVDGQRGTDNPDT